MEEKIIKLEKFLEHLDYDLENFFKNYDLKLTKNSKDWPERTFFWSQKETDKLLQIYLKNELESVFVVWGSAWKDKQNNRFWYKSELKEIHPPFEWKALENIFLMLKKELDAVREIDLKPVKT